jgi:hypothetical protein
MATRSAIGFMRNDGTVRAVYCHWDGYLSHVGKILIENYDLLGVDDLCDLGDISSLGETIEDTVFYGRDRNEDDVEAHEFASEQEFVDWYDDSEFFYLIKDDKWYVSEHCEEFSLLEDRLKDTKVKFTKYVRPDETTTSYSARDAVVAMVADGVVEPVYMVKLLLDRIDPETLEALLKEEFHIDEIIPECYFEEEENNEID